MIRRMGLSLGSIGEYFQSYLPLPSAASYFWNPKQADMGSCSPYGQYDEYKAYGKYGSAAEKEAAKMGMAERDMSASHAEMDMSMMNDMNEADMQSDKNKKPYAWYPTYRSVFVLLTAR